MKSATNGSKPIESVNRNITEPGVCVGPSVFNKEGPHYSATIVLTDYMTFALSHQCTADNKSRLLLLTEKGVYSSCIKKYIKRALKKNGWPEGFKTLVEDMKPIKGEGCP